MNKKTMLGMVTGTVVGSVCGGVIGVLRATTALCPPAWPIITAATGVAMTQDAGCSTAVVIATGVAGFMVGSVSILAAPIITPVNIITAPLFIPAGALFGAYLGYVTSNKGV